MFCYEGISMVKGVQIVYLYTYSHIQIYRYMADARIVKVHTELS